MERMGGGGEISEALEESFFLDILIQTTKKRKLSRVLCIFLVLNMILKGRAWNILRKIAACLFCPPTSTLIPLRWSGVKENNYPGPLGLSF